MTLNTPPQPYQQQPVYPQTPPMPKKSGCGCCLWGCFLMLILAVVFSIGGYFGIRYAADWMLSDQTVTWAYNNYGRQKIRSLLPPNMSEAEKNRIMSQADASLQDFFALSPEEKKVLKKEAMEAIFLYSQGQVIPPEKIPNLQKFIQKQMKAFEERPADSPNLLQ